MSSLLESVDPRVTPLRDGVAGRSLEGIVRAEVYECLDELSGVKTVGESRGDDIGAAEYNADEVD